MMTDLFIPIPQRDLIVVDHETSGLDPERHEITEMAAMRVTGDLQRVKGSVHHKLRLRHPERADREALAIGGYDEAVWAREAVHPRIALVDLVDLLGPPDHTAPVWLGINVVFDWSFTASLARAESFPLPLPRYFLDCYALAWPLAHRGFVEKINLETLCTRYGVPNTGAHRAMNDVRRTLQVYRRMMGWGPRGAAP